MRMDTDSAAAGQPLVNRMAKSDTLHLQLLGVSA